MVEDPDPLDRHAQLHRLVVSLVIAAMAAAVAASVAYGLAEADTRASEWRIGTAKRAWFFIAFMTLAAGAAAFKVTDVVLAYLARRRERLPPRARVVPRR